MRQTIAYEGREVIRGQILEIGSVEWFENSEIDVRDSAEGLQQLGYAVDLRNESDGAISADIHWFDDLHSNNPVTLYMNAVTATHYEDGFVIVHSGHIHHLFVAKDVPWGETGYKLP